jgi:hypothetical protein
MRIAIIAWGSLVSDPRTLQIKGNWDNQGPRLKIEFSRVSKDGRLTLVIDPLNGAEVNTYKRIGFVDTKNNRNSKSEFHNQVDVFEKMVTWCKDNNFDAAVWTALPSQFKDQTKMEFSVSNAIKYLDSLPKTARKNALNYINEAPKEVVTPVRQKVEQLNYQ